MNNADQTPNNGWIFFAQDGSWGDGAGMRFMYANDPNLVLLDDDWSDRQLGDFAAEYATELKGFPVDSEDLLVSYRDIREALALILASGQQNVLGALDDAVSNNLGD